MVGYSHQVSAVFNLRAQAESARKRLVDRGLGLEQLSILGAEDVPLPTTRRRSFIQVLSSGAAGALAGLLVSTLVTFALTRTEASLFGDAPLALLGWSSALGALFEERSAHRWMSAKSAVLQTGYRPGPCRSAGEYPFGNRVPARA